MAKTAKPVRGRAALMAALGKARGSNKSRNVGADKRATPQRGGGRTEADYQQAIIDMAKANRWKPMHIHDARRSEGAGYFDLTLMREVDARVVFAELKTEHGRLTEAQESWGAMARRIADRREGVECYLWRDGKTPWSEIERVLAYKPKGGRAKPKREEC